MRRERKFLEGARVNATADAVTRILNREYLMLNGKPVHPSFLGSWHLFTLHGAVMRGAIHLTTINPAWIAPAEVDDELEIAF